MKTVSDEQVKSFLKLLNMSVYEFEMGHRLARRIELNNIRSIWKILISSREMLLTIPGFGQRTLRELEEKYDEVGLNHKTRKYFYGEFCKYTNETIGLPCDVEPEQRLRLVSWIENWPSLEEVARKYLEQNL